MSTTDTLEKPEAAAEEKTEKAVSARPGSALGPTIPDDPEHDEMVLSDIPRGEQKWGWGIAFGFFVVALGFAAFAPVDAAVHAQGSIAVAGNRQTVQHREGGIISALMVREGEHVEKGQVLIELAPADVGAQAASLLSQMISLEAQRARLLAEYQGGGIVTPAEFSALEPEARIEAEAALARQRTELSARRATLSRQKGVLAQRTAQLNQQIVGLRGQKQAADIQREKIAEELEGMRSLAERGFASKTQLRALERSEAGLEGQQASLTAGQAQAVEQIGEARMQAAGLDSEYIERVTRELRDVENALSDVKPRYIAARDRLAGASIRAPASGEVVGLSIHTVGGVIAPGQAVLDVVPDAAPLVVEAQISPADADDLEIGQKARVRVVALREMNTPVLDGQVTRVSADRLVDQKTGVSYYTAQITVPAEEFARLREIKGAKDSLRAGLPVEVMVPLHKRTLLQYIAEPLTGIFWRSFREH